MQQSYTRHPLVFLALIILVAVGALAFRLPRLDQRPLHVDEANQAVKTGTLFDSGIYRYDPNEYHGPSLYYLTLPFFWCSRAKNFAETNETTLRLVPVCFGVGLVLLLLLVGDGLGKTAALLAAVLTAISPAMVYYSRYYIQEMLLVFFTFAAIGAGWRYARTRRLSWAIAGGVCLGLMHATKETCVIAYAAMAAALGLTWIWSKWRAEDDEHARPNPRLSWRGWHLACGLVAGMVVSVFFFSSFLTHGRGPLDSVLTYANYFHRSARAAAHLHPWYYYLQILIYYRIGLGPRWSEGLIVGLAGVGIGRALTRRGLPGTDRNLLHFLSFYTIAMLAAYSLIPYKTPWNMLSFLHGLILLAGVGAVAIVNLLPAMPLKAGAGVLLAVAAGHLGWQAWRGAYPLNSSTRNPYVYAQTSPDTLHFVQRLEELARLNPQGHDLLIKIVAPDNDYWPLPWYLRRFRNVGYWEELPARMDAPIIISSMAVQPALEHILRDQYHTEYFGLRDEVLLMTHIRKDVWENYLRQSSPVKALAVGP